MSSILGLTDVVFNPETGKWEVVPQSTRKPAAEPPYEKPTNLHDDPEAVRADRSLRKPT